jgi:hypothetical protein
MSHRLLPFALLFAALPGCGSNSNGPQNTTLAGVVQDYDAGTPLAGAGVALFELPGETTTADGNGAFSLDQLQRGTSVRVVVTAPNYRETVNPIRLLGATTVNVTAFAASAAFVSAQYAAVGITPTAGTAMVIAHLEDDLGNVRVGIPLADLTLLDQNQAAVGTGPFVFNAAGNLDNTLTQTAAFGGKSRIAFLNVPAGNYTLEVVENATPLLRPLQVRSDGVTLVLR